MSTAWGDPSNPVGDTSTNRFNGSGWGDANSDRQPTWGNATSDSQPTWADATSDIQPTWGDNSWRTGIQSDVDKQAVGARSNARDDHFRSEHRGKTSSAKGREPDSKKTDFTPTEPSPSSQSSNRASAAPTWADIESWSVGQLHDWTSSTPSGEVRQTREATAVPRPLRASRHPLQHPRHPHSNSIDTNDRPDMDRNPTQAIQYPWVTNNPDVMPPYPWMAMYPPFAHPPHGMYPSSPMFPYLPHSMAYYPPPAPARPLGDDRSEDWQGSTSYSSDVNVDDLAEVIQKLHGLGCTTSSEITPVIGTKMTSSGPVPVTLGFFVPLKATEETAGPSEDASTARSQTRRRSQAMSGNRNTRARGSK